MVTPCIFALGGLGRTEGRLPIPPRPAGLGLHQQPEPCAGASGGERSHQLGPRIPFVRSGLRTPRRAPRFLLVLHAGWRTVAGTRSFPPVLRGRAARRLRRPCEIVVVSPASNELLGTSPLSVRAARDGLRLLRRRLRARGSVKAGSGCLGDGRTLGVACADVPGAGPSRERVERREHAARVGAPLVADPHHVLLRVVRAENLEQIRVRKYAREE